MNLDEQDIIRKHQQAAPIDITAMADDLGLSVYQTDDLPDGISGMICRDISGESSSGYRIQVNARDAYTRQRFTVAHECAHYLLHRAKIGDGITDDAMYRSELTTQEEYEANNLAADLLMPRALVLQHYTNGRKTYQELAVAFDVSVQAMKVRLRYLLYIR